MTCNSFVDSLRDTIGIILTWLMGHLHDEDTPAEINFTKMEPRQKTWNLLREEPDTRADESGR